MTRLIFMPLVALLLMVGTVTAGETPDISVTDLHTAIKENAVTVIDVNSKKSYESGHVPGALHFSAIKEDLASHLPADKASLIVAYCSGPKCGAHKRATSAAADLGYTNVKHMSAGISGWNKAVADGTITLAQVDSPSYDMKIMAGKDCGSCTAGGCADKAPGAMTVAVEKAGMDCSAGACADKAPGAMTIAAEKAGMDCAKSCTMGSCGDKAAATVTLTAMAE